MGVGNLGGKRGLNKDGRKITTEGKWCGTEFHICKRGAGERRGVGGMKERIRWDDGYHSNRCYEKVERTPCSACLAYLLIF